MKYEKWLQDWLNNYILPTVKRRTYSRYSEIVYKRIIPKFGKYELTKITPYRVQCYVNELLKTGNMKTGAGLAANSVNTVLGVMRSCMKTAFDIGYIKKYELDKVKKPRTNEKNVVCFTVQEQKLLERVAYESKKTKLFGIILCLYSGLRIGELLALRWEDIDTRKGLLNVTKTCFDGKDADGKYKRMEDTPKTSSSIRTIPLPKQIIPLVKEYKAKSRFEYVVASDDERIISVRSYQRSFELLQKKLGIPHKGFHSLRHTFATRALENGMDVKTLSEIMGHKTPAVTLSRYVHSLPEHKRAMMDRLGKLMSF